MSSKEVSAKRDDEKSLSASLSKDMATQLVKMMKQATENDSSANAINAACNCAKQLRELMKLQFEIKKWQGK